MLGNEKAPASGQEQISISDTKATTISDYSKSKTTAISLCNGTPKIIKCTNLGNVIAYHVVYS